MSGAAKVIAPIAGAAAGFFLGGGPAGALAGYQLGSGVGSMFGGQAAPGQSQQVAPGVIQTPNGMLLSGVPGAEKGAMALPQAAAPGGGADKAKALQSALMTIGPLMDESRALEDRELLRRKAEMEMNTPRLVMPTASAGNMGAYGPNAGMAYLGGR